MTHIVTDLGELEDLVDQVLDIGEFAFDVETLPGMGEHSYSDFRLDPRRNRVVWTGIATRGFSFVVPTGHPHGEQVGITTEPRIGSDGKTRNFKIPDWAPAPRQLDVDIAFKVMRPLFYEPGILKSGCNIKFDLESIQKYYRNEVQPGPFFDVQVAAHMLNENFHDYKLGSLIKREFGFTYDKSIGQEIEKHGYKTAAKYNNYDAKNTWLLTRRYRPLIDAEGLDGLWRLEMDVLEVLLYMEQQGALLDVAAATKLKAELARDLARLKGEMFRIAGREVNLNSVPQKQKLFFDLKKDGGFGLKSKKRTKGGAPSTSREALELYQAHPFIEKYLEHEDVDKVHGTYLTSYLGGEVVRETNGKKRIEVKPSILFNGKLHANFKQHGTVTGRFSCSEPNLQNIPRPDDDLGKKVRGLFLAPPGHSLVTADYGQIEYIVMAHLSRDPMLVRAFEDGVDLHQYVAAMVFSKDMEDITKTERTTAKNTNFAVAYGAGDDKVAAMSRISLDEAVAFRAAHRKMMPRLYRWTDKVVQDARCRRPPHVTTMMGRKRRLPMLMSQEWYLRSGAERQAVNTVVQGSAADLIKLAMVRLHRLCDEEMRLSLSIHDELVLVVPDDRVEDGQDVMEEAMLGPGIQSLLSVPMKIDMHVVKRWSEAKE